MGLAEPARGEAQWRPSRVSVEAQRDAIRLGSLCRLAAASSYHVVSSDGEDIGTVVGVEASGRRSVPKRVWLRRRSTRRVEMVPLAHVAAVDALDHVLVLKVDRKAVDRRRLRLLRT